MHPVDRDRGRSGTQNAALSAATAILGRKQDEAIAGYESKMAYYQRDLLSYEAELAAWMRAKAETRGEPPEKPHEPIASGTS